MRLHPDPHVNCSLTTNYQQPGRRSSSRPAAAHFLRFLELKIRTPSILSAILGQDFGLAFPTFGGIRFPGNRHHASWASVLRRTIAKR